MSDPQNVDATPSRGSSRPPVARPDLPGVRQAGTSAPATGTGEPPARSNRGRRALGRHEVYGKEGVWIVAEQGGPVVAAFYEVEDWPGWWRGHCRGRTKKVYAPGAEPLLVAERFLHR